MKKIKVVLAILCLSLGTAVAQKNNEVLFEGKVDPKFNGTKISMYNNITGDEGSAIVANGKFQLVVTFTVPTRHMFSSEAEEKKHGGYSPFGILVEKPGKILIEGDLESFYTVKVSGSPAQDVLNSYNSLSSQARKEGGKDADVLASVIAKNPNSIGSSYLLDRNGSILDPEKALELYNNLSAANKETYFGKKAYSQVQGALQSKMGGQVKNFTLSKDNGEQFAFESLKGSYVLIDFWASWCGPCIEEFNTLRKLYETYEGKKPFKILGISTDKNEEAWRQALQNEKLPWTQVRDGQDEASVASNQFAVKVLPTTYLVDPEGKIIAKNLRGEDLVKKLAELFK